MSLTISSYVQIRQEKSFLNGTPCVTVDEQDLLKQYYKELEMNYPKFYKMDSLCKLGMIAMELLVKSKPELLDKNNEAVAMVFQSENGCLQTDSEHQADVDQGKSSPAVFVYTLSNIVCGEISIRYKWFGESVFFISDATDTKSLLTYAKSLILTDKAECCILGRLEAFEGSYSADLVLVENKDEGIHLEDLQKLLDSK